MSLLFGKIIQRISEYNLMRNNPQPRSLVSSVTYILTLSSCKQSLYVGSKVNWKKKSAYSWIWCQRICLPLCNNIYFLLSMGIKNCMKNLMTLNDQKCYLLVGHNSIYIFFFVSALLRDCFLCWDHWRGTWLLHLKQPC